MKINWGNVLKAGAAAAGGIGGVLGYEKYKSIRAQGDRTKGYINDAYNSAQQRMTTGHADVREQTSESLNARGMLDGGVSPIHQALSGQPIAMGHDLASGVANRNEGEFALERHDLDSAHTRALNENKADTMNAYVGAASQAISGAMGWMGAGGDANAFTGGASNVVPSGGEMKPAMTISDALLSGGSYAGVHPNDPIGNPYSAWHIPQGTFNAHGETNADFNSGAFG